MSCGGRRTRGSRGRRQAPSDPQAGSRPAAASSPGYPSSRMTQMSGAPAGEVAAGGWSLTCLTVLSIAAGMLPFVTALTRTTPRMLMPKTRPARTSVPCQRRRSGGTTRAQTITRAAASTSRAVTRTSSTTRPRPTSVAAMTPAVRLPRARRRLPGRRFREQHHQERPHEPVPARAGPDSRRAGRTTPGRRAAATRSSTTGTWRSAWRRHSRACRAPGAGQNVCMRGSEGARADRTPRPRLIVGQASAVICNPFGGLGA